MKKVIILIAIVFGFTTVNAQKAWFEPEGALMNEEITIYVDLNKFDKTLDHTQLLVDTAAAGEDMYMWTWSPYEFSAGTPKTNGIGPTAWKNSNPILKMTKASTDPNELIYTYTMIPTEFYEVDAKTVYENDIKFLVKPQDGGGYGDPDFKSEDLELGLEAPFTSQIIKGIPSVAFQNNLVTVLYDNNFETVSSMQNMADNEAYMYAAAWDTTGGTTGNPDFVIATYFNASKTPSLQMEYRGDGVFQRTFIPEEFFSVPAGTILGRLQFVILRKDKTFRTQDDLEFIINCWE